MSPTSETTAPDDKTRGLPPGPDGMPPPIVHDPIPTRASYEIGAGIVGDRKRPTLWVRRDDEVVHIASFNSADELNLFVDIYGGCQIPLARWETAIDAHLAPSAPEEDDPAD